MKTLVFDTETTNLIKNKLQHLDKQPHIIEFFGVSLDLEGNELESYHFMFDPGFKISEEVTRITTITPQMLEGKPKFNEHAAEIKRIIELHDEVVAHNLSYDKAVVDFEMKRAGLAVDWPELVCTVESTEHIKGFRLNLNALHELLFGEGFAGAHRAEADVAALANCFRELRSTGSI
jgi:DNA polymerase III epsilon subunit-like protein